MVPPERFSDRDRRAARIGGRYGRNAIFVGLASAALIISLMFRGGFSDVVDVVRDAPLQAGICLVLGPFVGHLFGTWAGRMILLKRWNAFGTSLLIGFGSVLTITLLFSIVALGSEGMGSGTIWADVIADYIGKPVFWTCVFGAPVIALVASIMAIFFVQARKTSFQERTETLS